MKQQAYSVLTGWTGDARLIIVGEFTTVNDAAKGRSILARTEEGTMQRPPVPSSTPHGESPN